MENWGDWVEGLLVACAIGALSWEWENWRSKRRG